jgi:hypothetical protein
MAINETLLMIGVNKGASTVAWTLKLIGISQLHPDDTAKMPVLLIYRS